MGPKMKKCVNLITLRLLTLVDLVRLLLHTLEATKVAYVGGTASYRYSRSTANRERTCVLYFARYHIHR